MPIQQHTLTDTDGDTLTLTNSNGGVMVTVRRAAMPGSRTTGPFTHDELVEALDAVAPASNTTNHDETAGGVLARLQSELTRRLDEVDAELRAQARCPDPDEHVRYDAALADAEKAERERDAYQHDTHAAESALARVRAALGLPDDATTDDMEEAAGSRPLTPDAITPAMIGRAYDALVVEPGWVLGSRIEALDVLRRLLIAALTEPPARPDGAEDVAVRLFQAAAAVGVEMTEEQRDALADHLAAMQVRVVAEEQP